MKSGKEVYGLSIEKSRGINHKVIATLYDGVKIIPRNVGSIQSKELDQDYNFKFKNGEPQEKIEEFLNTKSRKSKKYLLNLAEKKYLETLLPK